MPESPASSHDKQETLEEVKSIRSKTSKVLETLRELFDKAAEARKARDAENAVVKQTTKEIEETRGQLNHTNSQLVALEKEFEPIKQQLGSPTAIKSQIDALEYSLHMSYSPSREKEVGKQIKELSKRLKAVEKASPKLKQLAELRASFRELRKKLSEEVKQLKLHAKQSDVHHDAMLTYLKETEVLQAEVPNALEQLDEKRAELVQFSMQERQKRMQDEKTHKQHTEVSHKQKMQGVQQKAKEIMEKFKLGEPISLDELQVLQAAGVEI